MRFESKSPFDCYCFGNTSATNNRNRLLCVEFTASWRCDVFWDTVYMRQFIISHRRRL